VAGLPTKDRAEVLKLARKSMATMPWVPNVGPQTEAYYCEADEIFYGGEAGGGKTDLGVGLALTQHKRSLILRRINKDALKIKPRIEEILGSDNGYNLAIFARDRGEPSKLARLGGIWMRSIKPRSPILHNP
jgi:hypothetical protein